jgi:hypothetical protein
MTSTDDSSNPILVQYMNLWQQELFTTSSFLSPALAVGSTVAQAYILIQASGRDINVDISSPTALSPDDGSLRVDGH